eukprot:2660214-Rhodomonas_salina.1
MTSALSRLIWAVVGVPVQARLVCVLRFCGAPRRCGCVSTLARSRLWRERGGAEAGARISEEEDAEEEQAQEEEEQGEEEEEQGEERQC